jgi:uncharacterized membrane protein
MAPTAAAAAIRSPLPRPVLIAGAALVSALILTATARHLTIGAPTVADPSVWLPVHVAAAVPSIPLGAWVLLRRKGDRLHKLLGRIWAGLMMVAALSSFGLTGMLGHLGPIHILSVLVVVGVPRAIWAARSGRIQAHVRGMTIMFASTVAAGLFTFLPGRMLGMWLFG